MFNIKAGIVALILAASATAAHAGTLTFTAENVEARGGTLYVGVQTEDQFMQWDGIAGDKIETPTAGSHTMTFDLPAGDYAVSVWHDLGGDGEFDRTETGMPLDGWAMINGAKLRGAPTFDAVKISVPETGASASESVIYPR